MNRLTRGLYLFLFSSVLFSGCRIEKPSSSVKDDSFPAYATLEILMPEGLADYSGYKNTFKEVRLDDEKVETNKRIEIDPGYHCVSVIHEYQLDFPIIGEASKHKTAEFRDCFSVFYGSSIN